VFLRSREGSVLEVVVEGYTYPDAASAPLEPGARHWAEATVRVQTPRGAGIGPIPFISLFDLKYLANWLDQLAEDDPAAEPSFGYMEEPHLQVRVLRQGEDAVTLHVYFIIEPPPGSFHTEEASFPTRGPPYWTGYVDLEVSRAALREAANSLHAALQQLPDRDFLL
jgi:hypothetical protein